jgi:hypothetical protein
MKCSIDNRGLVGLGFRIQFPFNPKQHIELCNVYLHSEMRISHVGVKTGSSASLEMMGSRSILCEDERRAYEYRNRACQKNKKNSLVSGGQKNLNICASHQDL